VATSAATPPRNQFQDCHHRSRRTPVMMLAAILIEDWQSRHVAEARQRISLPRNRPASAGRGVRQRGLSIGPALVRPP
jgi:hypothetical protein